MDHLMQDLRYGIRMLLKSPGFTSVAVLTLALAIGSSTAIFSVIQAVLLNPLPYPQAERLVVIWNSFRMAGLNRACLSAAEVADLAEQQRPFEGIAAFTDQGVNLTGGEEALRLQAFLVSPNLFRILGVHPALGRDFLPGEGGQESGQVVVLSHDLWNHRFGADPHLVGQVIRLNGKTFTVVGVMPAGIRFPDAPGFLFPQRADLWIPVAWERWRTESRGNQYLRAVARMKPAGGSLGEAQADLDRIAAGFRGAYPDYYPATSGWRLVAVPLMEQTVGDIRPALLALLGAVGLVLLIACANMANLLLARGTGRRREIAIRTALGAGRGRLVRQLLVESLILALAGGGLGVLFAGWGVDLLVPFGPADIPRLDQAGVNTQVLAFTLLVSVATGLIFGLAPALRATRLDLHDRLKEGGRVAAEGSGNRRLRGGLVVWEMALALVVLLGAGLLLRSFQRLQETRPGFSTRGVLTLQLSLPRAKYPDDAKAVAFYDQLVQRLSRLPGVSAVGAVHPLPLSGDGWGASFLVEGQPVAPSDPSPHAEYAVVTPDYFRALSIPLRKGRFFSEQDSPSTPDVVLVDELLAARYWPGQDPVGKRLNLAGSPDDAWATVVGVVGHVRSAGPQEVGEPQIYLPFRQRPHATMYVAVRGGPGPEALAAGIRQTVRGLDVDLPAAKMRTLDQLLSQASGRRRFSLLLFSLFAAAAAFLASLGIYGVTAYSVAQRTHEIGVRMALGARREDVLRLVLGQGVRLVLLGVVLGLVTALPLTGLLSSLLFGISATDPLTFAGIPLLLTGLALLACYVPARKATRVEPMIALRYE